MKLYHSLTRFGDVIKLNINIDVQEVLDHAENYSDLWDQYNPNKPGVPRYCLPLTSIDGDIGSRSNMSLQDARDRGEEIHEYSFDKVTEIYKKCNTLASGMEKFTPHLWKSNLLKVESGGFWPLHRDCYRPDPIEFRLLIPLRNCNPPTNYFILDGEIVKFDEGSVYFVNTALEHCLFNPSFRESYWAVFTVALNEESIQAIIDHLAHR